MSSVCETEFSTCKLLIYELHDSHFDVLAVLFSYLSLHSRFDAEWWLGDYKSSTP